MNFELTAELSYPLTHPGNAYPKQGISVSNLLSQFFRQATALVRNREENALGVPRQPDMSRLTP
jgi:hypothetical protein